MLALVVVPLPVTAPSAPLLATSWQEPHVCAFDRPHCHRRKRPLWCRHTCDTAQMSITTSSCGREQQIRTLPSAGGSSGSGS